MSVMPEGSDVEQEQPRLTRPSQVDQDQAKRWQSIMLDKLHAFPWRSVPWIVGLACIVAAFTIDSVAKGKSTSEVIISVIEARDLEVDSTSLVFLDKPKSVGTTRVVLRAWHEGDPADIYLVHAHLVPSGAVIGEPDIFNVTSTTGADEGMPLVHGNKVTFDVRQSGMVLGVRKLDMGGEGHLEGEWTPISRLQNALTNAQKTGQLVGIGDSFWSLDPPSKATLGVLPDGTIEVRVGNQASRIAPGATDPVGDDIGLKPRPGVKSRPGNLITWAVDRVRSFTWFGDDRMQALKAIVFGVLDVVKRTGSDVLGDTTAEDIASDLGDVATQNPAVAYTNPETGWPPAPMEPYLSKPIAGEGQWITLDKDPFVGRNPGAPPAFVTSFIRTDRERSYTYIHVMLWDPRQVAMHMMAGTVEPKGATGEAGPGLVPRDPKHIKHLVAAMNGGFQAMHGEWGMMGDGMIYLPPKPYGATVAKLRDGSTGFGTWPKDTDVPASIVSYRQNLTVLVLNGTINPYKRTWWGGTPPEWEDRVHTTRTGICLTKENFIAYFYGNEIDSIPLAQAMVQARCKYSIHLDMNPGHTGLEFYRVAPTGQIPALGRPLDKLWEAEGPVDQMPGWSFRARRMVRHMGLMNFPRYIQREARDFFYLTLRSLLPGGDLTPMVNPAEPDEGKWRTTGLPQHGFPYAVATTYLRPDPARPQLKLFLIKIDPRAVRVAGTAAANASAETVLTMSNVPMTEGQQTLWYSQGAFSITPSEPEPEAEPILSASKMTAQEADTAAAAFGVQEEEGMLVYAELQGEKRTAADSKALQSVLKTLGCQQQLLLKAVPQLVLGGAGPADDKGANQRTVRLVRGDAPGARSIFEDTPIVGIKEWMPLQAKRIRYFKKAETKPVASKAGEAAPAGDQASP